MKTLAPALARNFLGGAPRWYKIAILSFLVVNPIVFLAVNPFLGGWLLVAEFIFTLAMALKCYPLQPGGLLAIEAVAIGMASPSDVFHETEANFTVILLLMFMVAGIYFMRDLLLVLFTKLLVAIRSKTLLAVTFMALAAVLSAFLDALTVAAVVIAVATGLYTVYHRFVSGRGFDDDHEHDDDDFVHQQPRDRPRDVPVVPAQPDDARHDRHRARRRRDAGRRTAEPPDRRDGRMGLRRVLHPGRARIDPGLLRRARDLRAARTHAVVRLRRRASRVGARSDGTLE